MAGEAHTAFDFCPGRACRCPPTPNSFDNLRKKDPKRRRRCALPAHSKCVVECAALYQTLQGFAPLKNQTIFRLLFACAAFALTATAIHAQDNYEIQVYGSETVPPGVTMVELHNNFTAKGAKTTGDEIGRAHV